MASLLDCNICGHSCVVDHQFTDKNNQWIKHSTNPILPFYRNAFGSVWKDEGGDYLYWCNFHNVYRARRSIGSQDWVCFPEPVLCGGGPEAWDASIDCAMVFKEADLWHLLYRGRNHYGDCGVGLAYSVDGCNWTKRHNNPVLTPTIGDWDGDKDRRSLLFDPWGIIKVEDLYYLWFNSENPEHCRCTGLATSKDLVHWEKDQHNPIFVDGRFCVFPFNANGFYYLIVPSGGFRRDGSVSFELYRDTKPTFYPESRKFVSTVLKCGPTGSFDSLYLDTPCVLTRDISRAVGDDAVVEVVYTGEGPRVGFWRHGIAHFNVKTLEPQ